LDEAVDAGADLLLSSAGVSVGAHDVVRAVLEAHGELSFWGVNIRPGKPLAFGSYRGVPFLGLPGNPVSALVTFEVFVRAILDRLVGSGKPQRWVVAARAEEEIRSDGRESYLRAHVWRQGGEHRARLTGAQDSGMLSSLVLSNGLLVVPAGTVRVERGEVVSVWMFDGAVVPEMPQPEPSPT
jgi:molybdopterin molybdotransferase